MDLVERLNATTSVLRREIEGLSDKEVSFRPSEGEWSIKEVLGHLCDYARFFHTRLFQMINQEQPLLPSWDQEEQWRERNAQNALVQDLLFEFSTQRGETVDMLADLVHWNWARQGRHQEHGRLSIRQLVELALAHEEEHHLPQLRQLKEQATASTA